MANIDRMSERSRLITLVLAMPPWGIFGLHRIFTGHRSSGMLQLITSTVSMVGIFIIFMMNYDLFDVYSTTPVALKRYLTVFGFIIASGIPLVIIMAWVGLDILQIMINRFDDADGHRVGRWFMKTGF